MDAVFADPNVAARGMIRSFVVDDREIHAVGNAIKIRGVPEIPTTAPPLLGGDTDHIVREVLGYDEARIASLEAAGAFGDAPAPTDERRRVVT
jgi:formyl-CoA transferase